MPNRLPTASFPVRTAAAVALSAAILVAALTPRSDAAGSKQLQRVRGTIGYQTAEASTDFKQIVGKFDLPDADFAVTRAQSAAVIALPDSSLVSLGENTIVQAGAFDNSTAGPGATIVVRGGSLRFDIRRPAGGAANYRFVTTTSTVGVRGTIGLLSFVNGITTVGCVVCAADSVAVTVGNQTLALLSGQFLTVSAAGIITTGALASVVGTFTAAGVPASASTGAVAAGLPAAGVAGSVTTTAIAGAAVAGAVAGTVAASAATPQPQVTPAAALPTPSSTPVPTPTQAGNVNLNGGLRAAPPPAPHPPAPPRPPGAGPVPPAGTPRAGTPPGAPVGPPPGRFGR